MQQLEVEWFLRQNLRSEQTKTIIPIVLEGGEKAFAASRLADYNSLTFDASRGVEEQLVPVRARLERMGA